MVQRVDERESNWLHRPGENRADTSCHAGGGPGNPAARSPSRHFNVVHWSEFEDGDHIVALENLEYLTGDVREFFRGLR